MGSGICRRHEAHGCLARQTLAPGKFEKVGGRTLKYDASIFPLYDGYAPGTDNTDVYESGGRTVWAAIAFKMTLAAVLLIGGGYSYWNYFYRGSHSGSPSVQSASEPSAVGVVLKPGQALVSANKRWQRQGK